MKKFIVIYYASVDFMKKMKEVNPEEMQKEKNAWMAWGEKCGDGLVEMGAPLGNGQRVTKSGSLVSESNVVGYSVLQANDIDAAKEMLKDHPHLGWEGGCVIEVYEAMLMSN